MVKKSNNKKKVLYKKDSRNMTRIHGLLIIMYKHLTASKRPAPAEYGVTAGVCRWAGSVSFLRLISGEPQRRGTMPRM